MIDEKMIECKVDDWDDFLKISRLMQSESTRTWLYRGEGNAEWKLSSGFERYKLAEMRKECSMDPPCRKSKNRFWGEPEMTEPFFRRSEYRAIQSFIKDACRFENCKDNIEWLALMQHYGAPTRLLDVTASIMVALYFAFEIDYFQKQQNTENEQLQPKVIWAIREQTLWHNLDEPCNEYLEKHSCKEDALDSYYANFLCDEYEKSAAGLKLANECLKHLGDDYPSRDEGIIPIILHKNNSRTSAQDGLFLFPKCLSAPFEKNLQAAMTIHENDFKNPSSINITDLSKEELDDDLGIIKFVFDPVKCHSADDILRSANISAKNLFPDLTGIAKNIKYYED